MVNPLVLISWTSVQKKLRETDLLVVREQLLSGVERFRCNVSTGDKTNSVSDSSLWVTNIYKQPLKDELTHP